MLLFRFGAETVAYWAQPPGVDFCGVLMLLLLVLSIIGVFQGKWDGEVWSKYFFF